MPVILAPEWEALWLDPGTTDPDRVLPLLQPFPAERMEAYRVGYDVGTTAPTWSRRWREPPSATAAARARIARRERRERRSRPRRGARARQG